MNRTLTIIGNQSRDFVDRWLSPEEQPVFDAEKSMIGAASELMMAANDISGVTGAPIATVIQAIADAAKRASVLAITTISPAAFVIAKFGGLTGTAKAIDLPVTTVQGWKDRGQIPQTHWQKLMAAAFARGHKIELSDFLDRHPAQPAEQARVA